MPLQPARRTAVFLLVMISALPVVARAQIGKLPVLAPLTSMRGDCRAGEPNGALMRLGITRINVFLAEKGDRRISVATNGAGQIMSISAFATKRINAKRTETEFATAIFEASGTLRGGTRSYRVNKTPAAQDEDRERRLTADDGRHAMELATAVARRCPARK